MASAVSVASALKSCFAAARTTSSRARKSEYGAGGSRRRRWRQFVRPGGVPGGQPNEGREQVDGVGQIDAAVDESAGKRFE